MLSLEGCHVGAWREFDVALVMEFFDFYNPSSSPKKTHLEARLFIVLPGPQHMDIGKDYRGWLREETEC